VLAALMQTTQIEEKDYSEKKGITFTIIKTVFLAKISKIESYLE